MNNLKLFFGKDENFKIVTLIMLQDHSYIIHKIKLNQWAIAKLQ